MALDRVAAILKVGDQPMTPDRQFMAVKEGMLADVITEREWGMTLEEIISADTGRVFAVMEVDPSMETFLKGSLNALNFDKEKTAPAEYRSRSKVLPLPILAERLGSSDLVDKLRGKDTVPMLDCRALQAEDFQDPLKATLPENVIRDLNAITSGSYNVGAAQTYTTWVLFVADLGTLTGDLTGTQKTDITDGQAWPANNIGAHTLTLTSDKPHYGDPTAGWKNIKNAKDGLRPRCTGSGIVEIKNLHLEGSLSHVFVPDGAAAYTSKYHDLLVDGLGGSQYCIRCTQANEILNMWNVNTWGSTSAGMYTPSINAASVVEHCTSYGGANAGFSFVSKSFTKRNLVAFDNGSIDYNSAISLATSASTDATGTAGLINLTAANELLSLSDVNANYLDINPTGTLPGTGGLTILAANTHDIRGRIRPNGNGTVSPGSAELLVAVAAAGGRSIYRGIERGIYKGL